MYTRSMDNSTLIKDISFSQFRELSLQDEDFILIDVRSREEYKSGHMPGAINLNVLEATFRDKIKVLNPDKSYYIYCRSGFRSRQAALVMAMRGFTKIYNLSGGITEWNSSTGSSK
jgi:rhodanese-related sulfurtransferase